MLAPWIIEHFPDHRIYVEPFGGAASVLMQKPRSYSEVYNEIDGEVVNVFRVLRDQGAELRDAIRLTPFSREEFELSYKRSELELEQARRTIIRSFMGFGSNAVCGKSTGFRACSNRSGTTPARDWRNFAEAVDAFVDRLSGVVIENRDAMECMAQHDSPETLHYVDPPYVHETRTRSSRYRFEMTDEQHKSMVSFLQGIQGFVVLSGYRSGVYLELERKGWVRFDRSALADGARHRVESLWLNPQAADSAPQLRLFA